MMIQTRLTFYLLCTILAFPGVGQSNIDKTPKDQNVTFLVKEGQTVSVKGNLKTGRSAVIIVRGTLQVEGDMIIHHDLNLVIAGEGRLIVGGNLQSQSQQKKEIAVSESGQFSVQNVFHTGVNMEIIFSGHGLIRAKKIVADRALTITGPQNFLVDDCRCAVEQVCNFCNTLVADTL